MPSAVGKRVADRYRVAGAAACVHDRIRYGLRRQVGRSASARPRWPYTDPWVPLTEINSPPRRCRDEPRRVTRVGVRPECLRAASEPGQPGAGRQYIGRRRDHKHASAPVAPLRLERLRRRGRRRRGGAQEVSRPWAVRLRWARSAISLKAGAARSATPMVSW